MFLVRSRVVSDRFHAHVLRSPTETKTALAYVRDNYRKHMAQLGRRIARSYVDEYSSEANNLALPRASTWLLKQAIGPPT